MTILTKLNSIPVFSLPLRKGKATAGYNPLPKMDGKMVYKSKHIRTTQGDKKQLHILS